MILALWCRLTQVVPDKVQEGIENLKCVALAIPEIIAIGVLVGGCEP